MKFFECAFHSNGVVKEEFLLHKAAYENDIESVKRLLHTPSDDAFLIDKRDVHGNTALHIATMLGHKEVVLLLLKHGAKVRLQTKDGWSSEMEAICYGDRETIAAMIRARRSQTQGFLSKRKQYLKDMLLAIDDFYMEVKWDFETWIPLLSKILPSDTCKIYKHGDQMRVDTTLVDFNDISWTRGDLSILFRPQDDCSLTVLDKKKRKFQRLQKSEISNAAMEDELDEVMSVDVITLNSTIKSITFSRTISGWLFKQEKLEVVGNFSAETYSVDGFHIVTRKRREHLSTEDVKRNKNLIRNLLTPTNSDKSTNGQMASKPERRVSLPPPPRPTLTWAEYKRAASPPKLGRPRVEKHTVKEFKPIVAMSEDFPLPVEKFVDILEIAMPLKQIEKLREFCQARLPPGFPVKLELPLIATISAKVTFEKFEWRKSFPPDFFSIPSDFQQGHQKYRF